ncbi:protein ABHD15 [Scleropages formosus]|uniref:Protein ABHD15 n=1 Tax=Scleropages formosus TaxID=113540 RepID=A0A8C9TYB8_SCLFO|nr:protein ABHD15-like [Scleropages formosus]XP_029111099.1 protein ABHD15-like [Scleropages formosus]
MLELLGALCVLLLLVASLWPASRFLGSGSRPAAALQLCPPLPSGISRLPPALPLREKEPPVAVRCVSDPSSSSSTAGAAATSSSSSSSSSASESDAPVALICKPSALANYLLKHCATFCSYAAAPRWSWRSSALLQTAFGACCWPSDCAVHFARDHLQMSDGGIVSLDWAAAGSAPHRRRRTSSNCSSPVLLIIPNSFGKITRNVLKLCEVGLIHGYQPVVFNRRSHNGTPLSTVKLQQFGDPADLREAVCYIRYRQPASRIYAVSESTGSGLLLSYLGECGSSSYVTAAACISPIFRCQSWFESGPSWLCHWALLLYQKFNLSRYKTALGEVVHTDTLFSSCSLRALEEALFCHSGLKGDSLSAGAGGGWDSYWERNEPLRDVDEVAVPVLCVCSQDDPVRGGAQATLPLELFENNPHFFLLLTSCGGHCGFSAPGEGAEPWGPRATLEFFRATTDFFAVEERAKLAARRRGLGSTAGGRAFRDRSVSTCKRLPACAHNIHAIYSWQRSYTR